MGSVKRNSKILRMTALASVFLVTSTSFDRAFAQDSSDQVLNGTVDSIKPPPQKRSLKLRKKQTSKPAPENVTAETSDKTASDAPVADAPTQQKSVPAPAPVVRKAPPSIAAVEKPAAPASTQSTSQGPVQAPAKGEPSNRQSFVNIPDLANPSPVAPLPVPRPPEFPKTPAGGSTTASAPTTPKVRSQVSSKSLRNGDSTGAADDEEREMYKSGTLKASDAELLPESANDLYTVKNERPLLAPGKDAGVIGNVKAGDKFEVVLPGERFARVRFADGRIGFIDNKAIIPSEPMPPIRPTKSVKASPKPITVMPPSRPEKLQAECVKCAQAQVDNPQAIDRKKTRPIADIARRLNHKNRVAGLGDSSDEPSSDSSSESSGESSRGSKSLHGIRTPSADYVRRMRAAAMREAVRPRMPSTWMRPKLGYRPVGGNRSKGSCYSAVKDVLVDMHLAKTHYADDLAMNAHKKGFLKRMGLVNILPDMKSKLGGSLKDLAWKAPVGAILVYDQGKAGHIEVKAENKLFCSDFCSVHPVNTNLARRLIAVYVP